MKHHVESTSAVNDEVSFEDEGPRDEAGRRWPDDRRHRYESIFQRVADDHRLLAQSLAPRGANIILTDGLKHAGARDPREECARTEAQDEDRHDHVLPASPPDERQKIQVHPEAVD